LVRALRRNYVDTGRKNSLAEMKTAFLRESNPERKPCTPDWG